MATYLASPKLPVTSYSPPSPSRMPLTVPNVANIFLKLRQTKEKSKAHHIDSCSGEPQTHPSLAAEGVTCDRRVPIVDSDGFVVSGAVDLAKLLRATRSKLLEKAQALGGNALVDEQWNCTICGPKPRNDGTFRVHITYSASATRSQKPDPQKPVGLDRAKGVPGLMTILERE